MTSKSLGGSCSPTPPSPPPPPLPPPNPPPPLAQVAQIVQQEMPTSSSSMQQQQQQQQKHHQHDVVMGGTLTPPPLPSTSTQYHQHSPGGASTTTSTPSSTSSAKGAGSSGSATTATTGTTTTGTATTGTAGTTTTAIRNKRQELSFAERIQVIQARTSGKSMRQLALQFGCGKTQILNILGQRDAYLKEWEDKQAESNPHISARKRRSRRTGNEETNQKVWDWYNRQKNMGVRVTGPMLQREARSIARNLNIPNFAASNGWLDSFRRLHNIGPQNKGISERRSGNPPSSTAATTGGGGHSSTTPEPRSGFGSMLVVPSSSTEFPGSSYSTQYPTSSRDAVSPSSSATSQRPPPPLEPFGYPLHSSSYYQHHSQLRHEEDEEEDEEDEEEARRSSEEIEFDPSRPLVQAVHPQRDQGAMHHPETEFGRSFAVMANFHDSSSNTGGPSTHHPSVSPSPYHPAQSSSSMDASDFHRHRGGYSDPYDRLHHHSSSSSNSVVFSPTDVYSPSRHPTGQHHPSMGGHRNNNNGSRSTDLLPIDCRRTLSGNLISPSFQQVSSNLFEHDFTPAPTFQSHESSRSIIQDGRARGNGGSTPGSNVVIQQQQQRRTSVLTSTHAVTAAAAAAAAARLENQQQQRQQQTNDERTRSSSAPGLELFPPGLFGALLSMVRSCGLSCLEYADDRGDIWLEIKPPSFATFRVPSFGYRTHLMRLLVDRHLSYWFEVLGHCVRSGTFRSLTSGGIDPSLVKPLLDSLNGGATVCHGRGSVLKRVHQFHPKDALEQGLAGQNYFTLPDYRYRSYDCARLIDAKTGATQCFACLQPYEPSRSESPPDGIRASSVIRLQQQQSRDSPLQPPSATPQQQEEHSRQQQQQQQHNILANEPLNLSIHHPMEDLIINSPERKKTGFLSISPDGFLNRNNICTGPRLLLTSPSVIARQSPQQPFAVQQTSPLTTHHHYHHHYYNGSKINANDPDDFRLAKLSLTNERPDWEHNSNTNRENLISKFKTGTEVDMRLDDPEFHSEWIEQEVLNSSKNVSTID